MTLRIHRDAVIASLLVDLPGKVFKPYDAPAGAVNYAVVWVSLSDSPQTRFTGGQWREVYTVTVHAFGKDDEQVSWAAERVLRLKGRTLTVVGRKLQPVQFVTQKPPELDDDGPTPLQRVVTQFDIISDPA